MTEIQGYTQTQTQQSPFTSPMNQYGSSIVLLTNPENELFKMELVLRSMVEQPDGKLRKIGDPLCNELGVNSIIGQTQALVSQVAVMSNFKKDHVPMLIDFLGDTLAKDLMVNKVEYGIDNPSARDKIYFQSLSTAFVCLMRAFEEGDRRFWKGSQQEVRTVVEGNQQKKGFLNSLWPKRK